MSNVHRLGTKQQTERVRACLLEEKSQKIAKLEAEIEELQQQEFGARVWENKYNQANEQIERLKDGLNVYGDHRVGCKNLLYDRTDHCDCGFDELMKGERQ